MTGAQLVRRKTSYDITGNLGRLNFLIFQLLGLGSVFRGDTGDKSREGGGVQRVLSLELSCLPGSSEYLRNNWERAKALLEPQSL